MAKITINARFGIAPNALLNEKDISLKAKGLYAFIQAKPDNWNFSAERIAAQTKDGVDGVRGGLQELEKAGYLTRKRYQDDKGFWQIEYFLLENPRWENPTQEKPRGENTQNISKKDYSKKDIVKKTIVSEQSSQVPLVIKAFESVDAKNKRYYGHKNQRKAAEFLIETYGLEKVIKVVELYVHLKERKTKYLPDITSPYELVEKWEKLKSTLQREIAVADNVVW